MVCADYWRWRELASALLTEDRDERLDLSEVDERRRGAGCPAEFTMPALQPHGQSISKGAGASDARGCCLLASEEQPRRIRRTNSSEA
jgi:hypothetical protein